MGRKNVRGKGQKLSIGNAHNNEELIKVNGMIRCRCMMGP